MISLEHLEQRLLALERAIMRLLEPCHTAPSVGGAAHSETWVDRHNRDLSDDAFRNFRKDT